MTSNNNWNYSRFYLAECDRFPQTELVFDSKGDCSPDEALLHAIFFFRSEVNYKEVDSGDSIRISGPYALGEEASRTYLVTDDYIEKAMEM